MNDTCFTEDTWRNQHLFKASRVASSLAYDLIAIRKLFSEDTKLSASYNSLLQSIAKENSDSDSDIRTALLHLKTLRLTHLPKTMKNKVERVIETLDQWLGNILAGGGHNFDFICSLA